MHRLYQAGWIKESGIFPFNFIMGKYYVHSAMSKRWNCHEFHEEGAAQLLCFYLVDEMRWAILTFKLFDNYSLDPGIVIS